MRKRLSKRLISLLLSAAILVTSVPVSALGAELEEGIVETQSETSEQGAESGTNATEKALEYQLNGGTFIKDYQAPETYPAETLPTWENLEKQGYAFEGWYDNPELTGEKVTSVSDSANGETVVLYAKWTDSYYYIDIPANITPDGSKVQITGKADGLYENEYVSVTVESENNWKLKDGRKTLEYNLLSEDSGIPMENGILVLNLSKDEKQVQYDYTCNLKEEAQYTGDYTDTLTFDISYDRSDYTVTYEANGGFMDDPENPGSLINIEPEKLRPGTVLNELPTAIKSGYTFIGWCYDEACTKYVDTRDRLLDNITLYASYMENQKQEEHVMASFARAIDVNGAGFTIQVTDKSGSMSADDILAACSLKNLSDFDADVTLHISAAGNGTFTISKANGWKEGSSYKLELKNDNLYFTGFDKTIREYEIAIHKDEVKNVELNHDIKYISIKEISNLKVNGQSVASASVPTMTIGMDGNVTKTGSSTTGSFTYKGKGLKVGDQIAVYSGNAIPEIGLASSSGSEDIAFFEITSVNGNHYTYRGSDTEDVLFMPDVLPLQADKDQDGDAENNSVTVFITDLTFGDDEMSRALQLDADTTVDEGDFLAFYTDMTSGAAPTYGRIKSVLIEDDKYIITYETVTWETVQSSMDAYTKEPVDGEVLLAGTDIQQMEADIQMQAIESGFAEEVANQIAAMAMNTPSFAKLEEDLEAELGADVAVTYAADIPVTYAVTGGTTGKTPIIEVVTNEIRVTPEISTKLKRFDGNLSGVRLALELSVPIVVHAAQFADFEVTITATFEQEARMDVNVDGEAIWKVWGIFPYIADYRVTASLDLYEYTGMGLDINFKSAYANNTHIGKTEKLRKRLKTVDDIVNELQDMMENGQEYISSESDVMSSVEADVSAGENQKGKKEEISVAKTLAERYAELLENDSDWVDVYQYNLITKHFRILYGVIDIALELDFVFGANMNISIGTSFWYKNAKRYVFALHVKGRKATSDTIDLVEEQYEFTAYAMGTLGVRAGVRLTVRVGLLSTELASVGLSAEVGGYVQVWGYLYYQLTYSASKGRNTRAAGAIYLEIGIYLEIKFRAQALSNAFSYTPTLYDAMWPLYTLGSAENVIDFSYDEEPLVYEMKREIKNALIPDTSFTMNYLDLKEGLDDEEYFKKTYEEEGDEYFKVTMTNDAFVYDPVSNLITVNPGNEKNIDGEMIITWRNQPGTFDTKTKQRRIKLHWDNLRDGYCISFYSNGGSYVSPIVKRYGVEITQPADPEKVGYEFAGWYTDMELTNPYSFPETMPDQDAALYAKWTPAAVHYTIKYYVESTNGTYELQETVKNTAPTGATVSPEPGELEGFRTPDTESAVVRADGSTVIEYYYARNSYTITYMSDGEVVSSGDYRYGTMLTVPAVYKPGYDYVGWVTGDSTEAGEPPELVPAVNTTYTAYWKASDGIPYTVRYYVQSGDSYVLNEVCYLSGTTGTTVDAPAGNYDTNTYHLRDADLPSGVIEADGSLVLRVYYDLNTYTLTYDLQADDAKLPEGTEASVTGRSGEGVKLASPKRGGYQFVGWYTDAACETAFTGIMPDKDTTIYAKWEAIKVNYTVRHYQENVAVQDATDDPNGDSIGSGTPGSSGYTLVDEEVFSAEIGTEVTPDVKNYVGFMAPEEPQPQTVTVDAAGNGNLVVEYYYTRQSYMSYWYVNDYRDNGAEEGQESHGWPLEIQYGALVTAPRSISMETLRIGYRIDGWYEDRALTKPLSFETMPAHDIHLYPKWVPEEITYYVEYHLKDKADGSEREKIQKEYTILADSKVDQDTITKLESFRLDGYTFVGLDNPEFDYVIHPYDPTISYTLIANEHTLTYIYDTNEGGKTETSPTTFGTNITREAPQRAGYGFAGWYTEPEYKNLYTGTTMPDRDLTLYGKWEQGKQEYQVNHYIEELWGNPDSLYQTDILIGQTGVPVEVEPLTIEGFVTPTVQTYTPVGGSRADNQVTYVYKRATYHVNYHLNGGEYDDPNGVENDLLYGAWTATVYRWGYMFAGWYTDPELTQLFTEEEHARMPARNLELYAKWESVEREYMVRHYLENAENIKYTLDAVESKKEYTGKTITPEVKTYVGFTAPEIQSHIIEGRGMTIVDYYYARNKYTLTAHDYCTSGWETRTYTKQLKYGASLPQQYRDGYTFGGWFLDQEYTQPYTGTMTSADLTIYAKWEPHTVKYKYTYKMQGVDGKYQDGESVEGTGLVGSMVAPEKPDYTGMITPDIQPFMLLPYEEYNIKEYSYNRQQHSVTFKLENGQSDIVVSGYYGTEVTAPRPSREGYTFTGWTLDGKAAATIQSIDEKDYVYVATWKVNVYTVSFTTNGDADSQIKDIQVAYGDPIPKPSVTPTRIGYTFKKWSSDIPETMPAYDINLTAEWSLNTYRLTYDFNGGNWCKNPLAYTYEDNQITLANPTRPSHRFLGWTMDGGTEYKTVIPRHFTGDHTYTAHWEEVKYTIEFSSDLKDCVNGGMQPITLGYDDGYTLPECKHTMVGHTFVGWSTKKVTPSWTPKIEYRVGEQVRQLTTDDIIYLYPVFRVNRYRVEFDYNLGYFNTTYNVYDFNSVIDFPNPQPGDSTHKWGYYLRGWNKNIGNGFAPVTPKNGETAVKSYKLTDPQYVVWTAVWEVNNKYEYQASSWKNEYTITDGKEREVTFTFPIGTRNGEFTGTGDIGLSEKHEDYVIPVENVNRSLVSRDYKSISVTISYFVEKEITGYAILRTSYVGSDGKTHKLEEKSEDLDDAWYEKYTFEIPDAGAKSIKFEFDANGGAEDKYIMDGLRVKMEYKK